MKNHTLGAFGLALSLTVISTQLWAAPISYTNTSREADARVIGVLNNFIADSETQTDTGMGSFNASVSASGDGTGGSFAGFNSASTLNSTPLTGGGFSLDGSVYAFGPDGTCTDIVCPESARASSTSIFNFSLTEETTFNITTTWDSQTVGSSSVWYNVHIRQFITRYTIADTSETSWGNSGSEIVNLTLGPGDYEYRSTMTVSATGTLAGATGGGVDGEGSGSYSVSLSAVPVPAAVWLFGSGLIGLIGVARRKAA